ncbi:MAG: 5-bromo-4-chloroindolyl phosphate hydrolysis family protein [Lachnospiraceae bacterium]|nr:5-bromo-4-chloroindolyl phosphate hydrolysis family protein [Lachnospiraceae bacterium]
MGIKRPENDLYEYQYTTPNKKVVREYLPAVKAPAGRTQAGKKMFKGRLIGILGVFFLLGTLAGGFSGGVLFYLVKLGIFGAAIGYGTYEIRQGKEIKGRIGRYKRYMKVLENKKYASIEELSGTVGKNRKTVVRDLEYMMENQWFLEAHLDKEKTQFMLTDKIYEQYQLAVKGQKMKEEQELKNQEKENDPIQRELNKVLQEGEAYIKKIHKLNDMILGDDISTRMDKIEDTLISIFDLLRRKPEKLEDIRKLMQYYLPMTIKILESYRDFENERMYSEQIKEGKAEIEETLRKVQIAFENLREKLFQEDILDVSTDLEVLEAMMSQEGLIDTEFTMKKE